MRQVFSVMIDLYARSGSAEKVKEVWAKIKTSDGALPTINLNPRIPNPFRSFRFKFLPTWPNDTPFRRKECRESNLASGSNSNPNTQHPNEEEILGLAPGVWRSHVYKNINVCICIYMYICVYLYMYI